MDKDWHNPAGVVFVIRTIKVYHCSSNIHKPYMFGSDLYCVKLKWKLTKQCVKGYKKKMRTVQWTKGAKNKLR